jgi:hypothetical protein
MRPIPDRAEVRAIKLGRLRATETQTWCISTDQAYPQRLCYFLDKLAGVGFQDPQHFCNRLGVLMRAVVRWDDVFALRPIQV